MPSSDFSFYICGNNFAQEERVPGAKGLAQGLGEGGDKRWLSHTCREDPGPRLFTLKVTLWNEFAWKESFILGPNLDLSACANCRVAFLRRWSESHVHTEWASGRLHTSASEGKAEVAPRSAFHVSINPKIERTQRQLQQLFKHWRATYPWKNVEEEQKQVP